MLGSFYALLAFFCMALFGILTKIALKEGSPLWVSFISYIAGAMLLLPYIARAEFGYLASNNYSFLFGRAFFGTLASFLYTLSIKSIPVVNGTLLFNTAPIFIPVLGTLFFQTKIAKSIWVAVSFGFLGVIVIIKPTAAIFTQTGDLMGIASGLSLAIAYLLMKRLVATDPVIRIIFYYLALGAVLQAPWLYLEETTPAFKSILYAISGGVALLTAQILLANAYRYALASEVGIYQYTSVIFVGLLSWLLWGIVPPTRDLIGIVLVIIAGVVIIRGGNQTQPSGNSHSKKTTSI